MPLPQGPGERGRGRRRPALRGPAAFEAAPRSWGAGALATVLTLLLLAIVGGAVAAGRDAVRGARRAARAAENASTAPERLVYLRTPAAEAPRVAAPSSPASAGPAAPARARRPV
ncbi:MAG: hypothetical protein ACJ79S_22370, partial [Gemmatimonadaceae bacterium]